MRRVEKSGGHAMFRNMTTVEKIVAKLKDAPPGIAEEVLEFLEARRKQRDLERPARFEDFFGILKDAEIFSQDPVALQRKWRDEWR